EIRTRIWESPRSKRVPDVLHSRGVVKAQTQEDIVSIEGLVRRGAQIDIVPGESAPNTIISPLREAPEMLPDAAGNKQAYLIDGGVVICTVMRCRRLWLIGLRVHERRD